ncbi:hypothetical protein AK88_02244 [Plasmodium fragile]|uniref:Uncharacterized protein n=1 Tax=Plasmodium fragile TaxID=5857 RepID=A0A0D9QMX9_PLAFR|nr:uncharacterized protein AK88_02244 [Plasmodium fragile]KJP88127.1 hypothetical protein AK88_02244 [Plasmodium fragile]
MRRRGKNAKKGDPKIASLGTAHADNPRANIPGVNFTRIKSSYLEGALKLTNAESVKQKLKRKNDELKGMVRGGDMPVVPCLDRVLSVQTIPSDHDGRGQDTTELKHFEEFEIVLRGVMKDQEGLVSREAEGQISSSVVENSALSNEVPFICDKVTSEKDNEEGEQIGESQVGEKIKEDEMGKQIDEDDKGNVSNLFNKTKEAYKSLNLDKLFLVNSFNNSFLDEVVDKRKESEVCEHERSRKENKLSLVKTIERKLKGQNSFVMENIYNAFRGTINDFIDVYLQGEQEDDEEVEEMSEGRSNRTVVRKDTTSRSVDPFRHGDRVNLRDEHDLKKMYHMDSDIFLSGGEKDKIKVGQSGYATKREEDTNIKNYLSQFGGTKSGENSNSHDGTKCCKIKMGGGNLFGERNVVASAMAYLMGDTFKQKSNALHTDMNKHKQVEEAYSAYYPEVKTFEYSSIMSDYLYNRKGLPKGGGRRRSKHDGHNLSSDHKCPNRDDQMSNVLDTQVNDTSVFDISPMTHKYKYASNIILTINKIKNIERVIEINLNIKDVELKVPGMRIENVIMPYKYGSDLLTIKIKTLSEGNGGVATGHKVMCRGDGIDGYQSREHKMKGQDTNEKNITIKSYFVFIPLNLIKDGVVNKRLILISSKRNEEFEKEGLLPDTLYMIESQKLNCEKEKHMYISIKICKNGIHFFPCVNPHQGHTLHTNYTTNGGLNRKPFEPVYVCLYNDEVDRAIGNILNGRGLANKVRINKLAATGHYMLNNLPFQFYFNNSNVLLCTHGDIKEEAENVFNRIGKEYIRVESFIDLFPTHIFPPLEDVLHLDLIEKNELLQLKFVLHFLAITEIICMHLCSLLNFHVDIQPLFRDHVNAVKMDDGTGQENRFTFLYTSYEEDAEPKGYFLNYTKPFIFRFHCDDNDLFIMDYARKQAIFLHNVIKNHGDIKTIPMSYDKTKSLFFTKDSRKKQFQIYYMDILRRYNFVLNRGDNLFRIPNTRDYSTPKISAPVKRQGAANNNASVCTNGVEEEKNGRHFDDTIIGALQGKLLPKSENAYRRHVTTTGQAKIAEERNFVGGNITSGEEQKFPIREEQITPHDKITNEKTSFYNLREYKNYHFHEKKGGQIEYKNGNSFEDFDRGRDRYEEISTNGWYMNGKEKEESSAGELPHPQDDEISYYNMHKEDVPFSLESVKWDFNDDHVYPGQHPVYAGCSNGYGHREGVTPNAEATPGGGVGEDRQTVSIADVSYGRGYNEGCREKYADRCALTRDARLSGTTDQDWVASKLSTCKVYTDHTDHAPKHCKLVRRSDNEA